LSEDTSVGTSANSGSEVAADDRLLNPGCRTSPSRFAALLIACFQAEATNWAQQDLTLSVRSDLSYCRRSRFDHI